MHAEVSTFSGDISTFSSLSRKLFIESDNTELVNVNLFKREFYECFIENLFRFLVEDNQLIPKVNSFLARVILRVYIPHKKLINLDTVSCFIFTLL